MYRNTLPIFLLTIFFIFFRLIRMSRCQDDPDPCSDQLWCRPFPNLSHPFWGGSRPQSCGEQGFKLDCRDPYYATIEMEDELTYRVLDVYEDTHTMKLAREDLWGKLGSCFELQNVQNTSLKTELFNYTSDVQNLTLFYGCNYSSHDIESSCPSDHDTFFRIGVIRDLSPDLRCESIVQVPVLQPVQNWGQLYQTLRDGFIVEYPPKKQGKKSSINLEAKLAIGFAAGFGGIALTLVGVWLYLRRKKAKHGGSTLLFRNISSDPSSQYVVDFERGNNLGVHLFSYCELEQATNNFDSAKELGDGGFGTVYYGKLKDGRAVAVKRLYEHNFKRVEQFLNEVEILTRLRHKNLVSLYGCTSRHSRELLLVYEYISNGTVADHLHGHRAKPGNLPWPTRLKIAVDTADALSYLHASEIIHRDVKTNNILIDDHFSVKVADFGLSRLFPTDVTHVSTAPQGTPGYVDPDYHQCYQLTVKSDVYSFGVVLIELISSKPAVDITRHRHEINLANLAINKIQSKALGELVDPNLGFETDSEVRKGVEAVAELAFGCLQGDKDLRPSMVEVLEWLKRIQGEICSGEKGGLESDAVVRSPDSVMMGWSTSNDSTPNTSV